MPCNIINDTSKIKVQPHYDSNKNYLIRWKSDNAIEIVDGWNLGAIKHRDLKEGSISVVVLREATKEDIEKYSECKGE